MRLEKVQFLVSRWFLKLIFVHSFKGANAGCCLLAAACLLLAVAAACCCLLLLAAACCCLLLLAAACLLLACCLLAGLLACSLLARCLLAACLLACLPAACLLLAAAACLPGWIGQQTFWELPTTLMHIAPAIDLAAENKGPPYPYIMLDHSPANRICYS